MRQANQTEPNTLPIQQLRPSISSSSHFFPFSPLPFSCTPKSVPQNQSVMWPSEQENNCNHQSNYKGLVSASSSNSRSYSSSSNSSALPQTPRRTLEEVWKDITLTTLHERPMTPPMLPSATNTHTFRGIILQDFLAGAFKDPTPAADDAALLQPRPALPPTILSLNSALDFQQANSNSSSSGLHDHGRSHNGSCFISGEVFPDAAGGSPTPPGGIMPFCAKKQRTTEGFGAAGRDRRHKRMIKNRESAARSRARKQAYTNELELEVAHLVEENARLRRQQEELRMAMAAQMSKKNTLQRTSTAPF